MASRHCVGQRPDGLTFLCIFKWLYLAYLHQTWGFCKANWSALYDYMDQ